MLSKINRYASSCRRESLYTSICIAKIVKQLRKEISFAHRIPVEHELPVVSNLGKNRRDRLQRRFTDGLPAESNARSTVYSLVMKE